MYCVATGDRRTPGGTGMTGDPGPAGPLGQLGPLGATGLPGDVGDQGRQGIAGQPGPQGPRGATGPSGSLGGKGATVFMSTVEYQIQWLDDVYNIVNIPVPRRLPVYAFFMNVPLIDQIPAIKEKLKATHTLEDCALQLYKYNGSQCVYGSYLDLEMTLAEQSEELDGFSDSEKNSILLRTKLSVRVHACIEKLLNSRKRVSHSSVLFERGDPG